MTGNPQNLPELAPTGGRHKRQSIQPTYDSRETGLRYHVTYRLDGRVLEWEKRIEDPFGRFTVHVGWRDLLRGLLRRRLTVDVLVGADPEVIEDVMELDANYLGTNCTRRDEFNASVAFNARQFLS